MQIRRKSVAFIVGSTLLFVAAFINCQPKTLAAQVARAKVSRPAKTASSISTATGIG